MIALVLCVRDELQWLEMVAWGEALELNSARFDAPDDEISRYIC
jgi:hypothetical protein